jgi:DNA-binding transcriptional ArsR family regulator
MAQAPSSRALFSESGNVPGELRQDTSEFNVIFVHSRLDDYGLPASVFRVYCHLARRAGSGAAFPAVASIARICRLHPQTVRQALRVLVQHRLITREPRPGTTPIYRLTPAAQWQPPTNINGSPSESDAPPLVSESTPAKQIKGHPSESDAVEGNPFEGDPKKEDPHSPPMGDSVKDTESKSTSTQSEAIYEAYPKKVGRPAALRAIRRALAKHTFEFLLERTRLYAQTCNSPTEFIPNPSTWFNQERFNDEPATWRRTGGSNGRPQPAIIRPDKFGCGVSKL